ncbi:hypothetical protein AgCh_040209 [Apium graveolens]
MADNEAPQNPPPPPPPPASSQISSNMKDSNLKFLLALSEKWDYKVTSIMDNFELNETPLDEIYRILKNHELEMEQRSMRKGFKSRPVALRVEEKTNEKARRKDTDSDHGNNEDMKQMAALLVKSFKKMVYKNFKKGKRFFRKVSSSSNSNKRNARRNTDWKESKSGKLDMSKEICYNCDGIGHFAADCRKSKTEKKQALIIKKKNWDDSSDSDDGVNYALMVNADTTTLAFDTDDIHELRLFLKSLQVSYRDQTLENNRIKSEEKKYVDRRKYTSRTVKQLRQEATARGISATGSKKELIDRLSVANNSENSMFDGEEIKHVDDNKKKKLVTAIKKGAAVLDQWLPDEIKLQYHVLQRGDEIYDAMLNHTNVGDNRNKFHVIQLLESDDGVRYMVYSRWGREDPLYSSYQRLNCYLLPLEVDSKEFSMVSNYMKNTHVKTNSNYTVDIVQILRVSRKGEAERFKKVALGDMVELLDAKCDADKLPDGKLSTKGIGATAPDFSEVETLEDGVVVPLGKPKQRSDVKVILLL